MSIHHGYVHTCPGSAVRLPPYVGQITSNFAHLPQKSSYLPDRSLWGLGQLQPWWCEETDTWITFFLGHQRIFNKLSQIVWVFNPAKCMLRSRSRLNCHFFQYSLKTTGAALPSKMLRSELAFANKLSAQSQIFDYLLQRFGQRTRVFCRHINCRICADFSECGDIRCDNENSTGHGFHDRYPKPFVVRRKHKRHGTGIERAQRRRRHVSHITAMTARNGAHHRIDLSSAPAWTSSDDQQLSKPSSRFQNL